MTAAPRATEAGSLTPKQEAFARQWLIDQNGTQAAIRAGYSPRTANEQAARLLAKASVQAFIDGLKRERDARLQMEADEVIRELSNIARYDPAKLLDEEGRPLPLHKIPPETRRALASYDMIAVKGDEESGGGPATYITRVKWCSKVEALDRLGKHRRLFSDKLEIEHQVTWADIVGAADDERKRRGGGG